MILRLIFAALLLFAVAAPTQESDDTKKEKPASKGVIHLQEVKDVAPVHAAQACNNFSWAAALATVLAKENAEIKQDFWLDKYYGGSVCLDQMGSPDDLVRKADGEYVLDDGRHVELTLTYHAGVPANASDYLVPIMQDQMLILFADGEAEPLVGAMWDEYRSERGERMIDLKELHVLNLLASEDKQRVILDMTGDDANRITGYMNVQATEVNKQYWPK